MISLHLLIKLQSELGYYDSDDCKIILISHLCYWILMITEAWDMVINIDDHIASRGSITSKETELNINNMMA